MTPRAVDAHYTVNVSRDPGSDTTRVEVFSHGRRVAIEHVSTVGGCMTLGALLVAADTPTLPTVDSSC